MDLETPKANPVRLFEIIEDTFKGEVVLPEFQRSFIWQREDIEDLLISILQGYFIGTFLFLETSADKPMFPFRLVEGLEKVNPYANPRKFSNVKLILDGQQRITSIFYSIYEPGIPLSSTKYPYRFFFRLEKALNNDLENSVVGISISDRRRLSEIEKMVQEDLALPFSIFRNEDDFDEWFYTKQTRWSKEGEEKNKIKDFFKRFKGFMVPVVTIPSETSEDNIVNMFERINRTGVSLSIFDLAVARLYNKNVKLRDHWEKFAKEYSDVSKTIKPEFILKVIALLCGKEVRKSSLLDVLDALGVEEFEEKWRVSTESVVNAYTRLTAPHGGYGAITNNLIPYQTLIVPLAFLLHQVEKKHGGEEAYRKVDRWYWGSVFSQRYDQAVDSQTYRDVKDVLDWLDGKNPTEWLEKMDPTDIDINKSETYSAIYRGMMSLIVLAGAKDFINGQTANLKECHDDHIFPKSIYKNHPDVDSILNRTLISKTSNERKSNKKPSEYLPIFLEAHGNDPERLRRTLESHLISEEALQAMKQDNFEAFLEARKKIFFSEIKKRIQGEE
ncbi:GmrSD restriction endonuclease domain-containing protein [Thermanaerothrix sp.]|uniref:GmrSD restriction endonuclease domain-containing protein n=1 Tax=Thermanaerothrix sp. TaxID=2972675 RepID=UPI003C7A5D77